MAVTQADVDALESALNSGVLTVSFDGPPRRSITYQSAADMQARLDRMKAELLRASGKVAGYRLISTKTGF